jgi:hypothetical protein
MKDLVLALPACPDVYSRLVTPRRRGYVSVTILCDLTITGTNIILELHNLLCGTSISSNSFDS